MNRKSYLCLLLVNGGVSLIIAYTLLFVQEFTLMIVHSNEMEK